MKNPKNGRLKWQHRQKMDFLNGETEVLLEEIRKSRKNVIRKRKKNR